MHVTVLTLVSFLFDSACLEIENATGVLGFLSGQLFANLFYVFGVHVVKHAGAEPVVLALIEDGSDGVGDVDDAAGVARHHEQEPVSRLQDQMLQLLVR